MKAKYGQRFFSSINSFKASDMIVTKIKQGFARPDYAQRMKVGEFHTDHMLEIDWDAQNGWSKPYISPYHPLEMDPRNSALHYAISLFDGLKAFKRDDDMFLFRPELNMERMNNSAERVGLPKFDEEECIKCIEKLVYIDRDWALDERGYSLYIRPMYMAYNDTLGVSVPNKAKLFMFMSPVGPCFSSGYNSLSLICNDNSYIRTFPGIGERKLSANYGPTLQKYKECLDKGYSQILWLFNDNITECGVSNYFTLIKDITGQLDLVTCNLDGTVVPGVIRQTILDLARSWGLKISERQFSIHELIECYKEGRVSIY